MKLILRADVENLGNLGDVVTVKPGYGRNFLLPQGLAMVASEANMKAFELERKKLQERMDALRARRPHGPVRLRSGCRHVRRTPERTGAEPGPSRTRAPH